MSLSMRLYSMFLPLPLGLKNVGCSSKRCDGPVWRKGKTLSATKLLNKLLVDQHKFSDNTHCALLHAFLMNKDLDNAMEVFRKMQKLNQEMPVAVLHSLLESLFRFRKSRYAKEVFEAWTVAGKPVASRIYSPLIRVLVKDRLYQDAFSVFEYLQEHDVNLSNSARMAIIEAFLYSGRLDDSAALLRDSPGLPDNFNIAMVTSLMAQDAGKGLQLPEVSAVGRHGLPEVFIHMYIKEGRISDAEEMLLEFTKRGYVAHQRIYHMLMGGYFSLQQEDKCVEILQRLTQAGLCPDRSIYDMAFKALTKIGNLAQAKQLYSEMVTAGVAPLMTSFKYLMHMLVLGGENDLAHEVFLDLLDLDIHPTSDLINIAMREYVYLGNYEAVFRFLQHIVASGVVPTLRNFGYIIDALVRSSRLEDAERVLGMVRQCNLLPDVQMCTLIIQGHVRSKDMARAQKILDDMQAWGIKPDTITYAVITRGLILSSQFSKTRDLFSDMQAKGLTPDLYNYSCLVGPHMIRMGSIDAENFLAQLLEKGIQPDGILFCLLMNAILSNLGSFELIRYARKHADTIFKFDEPLRFLTQSARRHRELLPGVAEFWNNLKDQGFEFKPEHYHHYIFALLSSKEFDGAAHIMDQAMESQVGLLDRTLTLIESFRERYIELLSDSALEVFEDVLSPQGAP
ncbi:hypothetical protein DSO57_1008309 [Entomophthora muscae]|uniref:Uncharacterized protein n=1 Tax=Entomophthora muscae TaxID=34485 RepID=A0ACC2UTH5_9FUNG|nr:hypothetical protein DSO57_1008309 [Entomophthora muscae]